MPTLTEPSEGPLGGGTSGGVSGLRYIRLERLRFKSGQRDKPPKLKSTSDLRAPMRASDGRR
jgi:hypothetical protein